MSSAHANVPALLAGDRRALARLITAVEDRAPEARSMMKEVYPHTGKAHIVGITGAPGVGKSTLVDALTAELRKNGLTVGIIAVDPTSPFTGGAILGDRIRMQGVGLDEGVFIRSLATRGHLGGLSRATSDVIRLMDAFGKDVVIVETVGAGQAEVDIVRLAQTTVVVTVPGLGDDIQAIKAGILEIGDVFVVNKADHDGAERAASELELMLSLNPEQGGWRPPIVKTVARDGAGLPELAEKVASHLAYLRESGRLAEKNQATSESELKAIVTARAGARILGAAGASGLLPELVARVAGREVDPYSAADEILRRHGGAGTGDGADN
ncbi:MAG: methylmalonyl Co-A mutase-associated GTPase MeaB [Bacillota bacterium]